MENNQKLDRKWIEIRQKMDTNQIENILNEYKK